MLWTKQPVQVVNGFQLMNLVNNQVSFLPICLSGEFEIPGSLSMLGRQLRYENASDVLASISQWVVDLGHPIVLLSEREKDAVKLSRKLEKLEYKNVYVLEGGVPALLEFAEELS